MNPSPQTQGVTDNYLKSLYALLCHLQAEKTLLSVVKSVSDAIGSFRGLLGGILLFYVPKYISCLPMYHKRNSISSPRQ